MATTAKCVKQFAHKLLNLTSSVASFTEVCFAKNLKAAEQCNSLLKQLTASICSNNSTLISVGSMITKLSCDEKSDLDLAFITYDQLFWTQFHNNTDFKIFFMDTVSEMIANCPALRLSAPICPLYYTNVPLLVCKLECGLNMDIQFPTGSFQAVRNTHLIRHYVLADVRFAQVYFYVRKLFQALGLRNSRERLFSSYHLICLVLHFLHRKDNSGPSVLPVLNETHNDRFNPTIPIKRILAENAMPDQQLTPLGWKSENMKSMGELVVDFFDYYANHFNANTHSILLRSGEIREKKSDTRGGRLIICDPYSTATICRSDTLSSVMSPTFKYIFDAITTKGEFLDSFPHFEDERTAFRETFREESWGQILMMDGESSVGDRYALDRVFLQELCLAKA